MFGQAESRWGIFEAALSSKRAQLLLAVMASLSGIYLNSEVEGTRQLCIVGLIVVPCVYILGQSLSDGCKYLAIGDAAKSGRASDVTSVDLDEPEEPSA